MRAELTRRMDSFNADIRDVLRAADSRRQLQDRDVAAALGQKVRVRACVYVCRIAACLTLACTRVRVRVRVRVGLG